MHTGGGLGVHAQLCEAQPAWAPRLCTGGGLGRRPLHSGRPVLVRIRVRMSVLIRGCVSACVWARPVRTPLCMSMFVHMLMDLHECRAYGCVRVHVHARAPGAGCGSENPPCSSCFIQVSPFLIWELKIARAQPCPSRQGADGQPHRAPQPAYCPPPFLGHCPACLSPPRSLMSSCRLCSARPGRGWGGAEALPTSRRWTQARPDKVKHGVGSAPSLQPGPTGRT